jgi:cell division protein FtsW (lipid II flippase)
MERYLKAHEDFVREQLAAGADLEALGRYHRTQIEYMQHERLIHLLVMLFVGLCTLVTLLSLTLSPNLLMAVLLLLFVGLLIPYVVHYYRLENGVQRWYHLANEIELRAGHVAGRYDGAE